MMLLFLFPSGGKLGDQVVAWVGEGKMIGDLQIGLTEEDMREKLGHKAGSWLYRMCRGTWVMRVFFYPPSPIIGLTLLLPRRPPPPFLFLLPSNFRSG